MPLMQEDKGNIVLFYPNIPEEVIPEVTDTLNSRWIGQGPKVDLFEREFAPKFTFCYFVIIWTKTVWNGAVRSFVPDENSGV